MFSSNGYTPLLWAAHEGNQEALQLIKQAGDPTQLSSEGENAIQIVARFGKTNIVKYILKRILISIIILFGVSIIVYSLMRMMPTDFIDNKYAEQLQNGTITQEQIDEFKEMFGLADNSFGGIVKGYFGWLGNLMKGDLGYSFKYEKPVGQVISENMWISFSIAIIATILQFLIAIPLGIVSATKQYSAVDYIVTIFTMIGLSLPTYFFAAIAIKFFAVDLGILPFGGLISATASYPETFLGALQKLGDMAYHLILPIFVSVILSLGGLMRYTRTNTLEVLGADYIRTARAKGLSERTVIYKHAFRNTLIPIATLLAGILPSLFGGMMITEQVFGIDGIGRLSYNALVDSDIQFVMGYNMFLAILAVIGTLLSDIMYSIVDPRVKLTK